jgi:hypothetical protein
MKMMHDDFEAWIRDTARGCMEEKEIDTFCHGELDQSGEYTFSDQHVQAQWMAWQAACRLASVKEGPLNSERWTLGELIAELEKWRELASGKTCVSFENLCFGASSLWHQTHRDNFRKVDRKPEALSRWILATEGHVTEDFPKQVLEVLQRLSAATSAESTGDA